MDILVGLLNATHTVPGNPSVVFQLVKRVAGVDVEIFEGGGQKEAVGVQVHSWGQQVSGRRMQIIKGERSVNLYS